MAEGSNRHFEISIKFLEKSDSSYDEFKSFEKKFYLDTLSDESVLIDFSDDFSGLGVSGNLVYDKASNTISIVNVNNEDSKYLLDISISAVDYESNDSLTFNLVGDNIIKGSLLLDAAIKDSATLTGDGSLDITSYTSNPCLTLYQSNWEILDTKIKLQNTETGLDCSGTFGVEVVNSTIDIQSLDTALLKDYGVYGIKSGDIEFIDSMLSIKQKGELPYGLFSTQHVKFNDSYVTIDVEGTNDVSFPIYMSTSGGELVLDVLNSEVYLNSKINKDPSDASESLALGVSLDGPQYSSYINVSGSIFEAQGNTAAISGNVRFKEAVNKVYIKKDLKNEKILYPIKNQKDKEKLGSPDMNDLRDTFKYVRIEPDLKSFEIDADSQPVDQNIYVFDHWESKGFIIEHPNSKRTTVKIPVIWPKGAYLNAVWKKINGPEVIYQTIPMTFTDVKTVYKTTRLDMAYLKGYPEKTIMPEGNMTRAEAVTTLVRLERYKGKDARDLKENSEPIYSDVEAGIWYKKYIDYAYAQGWLEESKGQMFYPDRPITRAELAQLISYVDNKISEPAPFTDIEGHPFKAAINQAYANGRIKGYEDNTFRPDGNIKRVEVATMLNRLYNRQADKSFISKNQDLITKFKDLDSSHWGYYELVEAFESHQAIENENGSEEWQRLIGGSI
ncbi:S-layer homology domain-containing protein [Neofamilia massiliensis]|uniref:S-layer homology domain-containing protein n=1 Tax=Neofamilia massiliensis TaxID=1673724 RepID=UPI0006BB6F71|nr:S-layer homology domain-containing protein [Neofamilia massiliensis]